jgi:hypothetical protein
MKKKNEDAKRRNLSSDKCEGSRASTQGARGEDDGAIKMFGKLGKG